MTTDQRFETILKNAKHSITHTRRHIFSTLQATPHPMTMHQLIEKVANHVDRVSVYRTVVLFEQLNIVHRIHIGWKYKIELSDAFLSHHHHISCIICGTVVDIHESATIEQHIAALGKQYGFTLTHHQLEIQGYCAACRP